MAVRERRVERSHNQISESVVAYAHNEYRIYFQLVDTVDMSIMHRSVALKTYA